MADVFQNTDRMWFGTRERMQWIDTPNSGANVSPSGVLAEADLINGGAFIRNSVDSHKNYSFTWGNSADRRLASCLRAYRNGSYGRGPIHFIDPMYYETNVLPHRWSDPSMAVGDEAVDLTGGLVAPTLTATPPNSNGLPITSAVYNFAGLGGWSGEASGAALYIPIPDGMELVIGAYYSATGGAAIAVRHNGSARTVLPQHAPYDETCMDTIIGPGGHVDLFLEAGSAPGGTITIAGMIARMRPAGSGEPFDGLTIENYAPSLYGATTPVEVYKNYAPSLYGPTVPVEVRRNYCIDPLGTTAGSGPRIANTRWAGDGVYAYGVPVADHPEGIPTAATFTVTSPRAGHGFDLAHNPQATTAIPSISIPSPEGTVLTVSLWMKHTGATPASALVILRACNGSGWVGSSINSPTFTLPLGEWVRVSGTITVPAGATHVSAAVTSISGYVDSVGDVWSATGALYEYASTVREIFAPSLPSPDPDMTARWLGAANASEAVLEGQHPTAFTDLNCVSIIHEVGDGTRELRLIPTGTSADSFTQIALPVSTRASGTVLGTSRSVSPISPPVHVGGYALGLRVGEPTQTTKRPNDATTTDLRLAYTSITTGNYARWYHGGTRGSGDVYWSKIGLYPDVYNGPHFDEHTGSPDPDMVFEQKSGYVALVGQHPTGFTDVRCVSILSGDKLRLIPTSTSNPDSYTRFGIPTAVRTSGTARATAELKQVLTGTLASWGRRISVEAPGFNAPQFPNSVGVYQQRQVYGPLTSLYQVRLFHGGLIGSGDVYWSNIGLFEGDYQGPWFDGIKTFPASGEAGFGEWYTGEGHSGCRFVGSPAVYNNDGINGGHVSLSCELRETGSWE